MRRLLRAISIILSTPGEKARLYCYWLAILSVIILIPNVGLIYEVLANQVTLPMVRRIAFVFSLYSNTFRFILEPVMLTTVLLSVVLALNFLVIRFVRKRNAVAHGRFSGTVAMLAGSHCVACGSSLLAPLFSLIGGTGAYLSGDRYLRLQLLSIGLNLLAMYIAVRSMKKAAGSVLLLAQDNPKGGNM